MISYECPIVFILDNFPLIIAIFKNKHYFSFSLEFKSVEIDCELF